MRAFVAIACVVLACLYGEAIRADTKEFDPEQFNQVIKVFDTKVKYPAASWQDDRLVDASEYYRQQEGPSFVFEQIPKGEKFDSWTKLYAIHGQMNEDLTYETYVKASLKVYFEVCGPDNFKLQVLQKSDINITVLIFCEDSPNATMAGYGAGVGEVTLMYLARPKTAFIKVYQHWRGDAYKAADQSSWPVGIDAVQMMIKRFQRIAFEMPK